jgi:hypothetical protein
LVHRLYTGHDFQEVASGNSASKPSDVCHSHLLHPGANGRAPFLEFRTRMAIAMPRQFYLRLSRGLCELRRNGNHPHIAILTDFIIRCHNDRWPTSRVAALRVQQLHPDDAAATQLGHEGLRSEFAPLSFTLCLRKSRESCDRRSLRSKRFTLLGVKGGRGPMFWTYPIEVSRRQGIIPGSQVFQIFHGLPASEHFAYDPFHGVYFR